MRLRQTIKYLTPKAFAFQKSLKIPLNLKIKEDQNNYLKLTKDGQSRNAFV